MSSMLQPNPVGLRAAGALIGAGVSASFLFTFGALAIASRSSQGIWWPLGVGAFLSGIGVPVAGLLGWWQAPGALSSRRFGIRNRLQLILVGVVVGVLGTGMVLAVGTGARMSAGADLAGIVQAVGFAFALAGLMFGMTILYGLVLAGVPAVLYGLLVEWIWIRILRRVFADRPAASKGGVLPTAVLAPLGPPVIWLSFVGVLMTVAAAVPTVVKIARADDPPGILYGSLFSWSLILLAPAGLGVLAIRRRSWSLILAPVPGLLALALIAGFPAGLIHVAAALAFGAGRLAARGVDTVPLIAASVVAVLCLAAPAVHQVVTEKVCWDVYPEFGLEMRESLDKPNGPTDMPILSSGCSEHTYSALGAAVGLGAIAAAGLIAIAGRRPERFIDGATETASLVA